MTKDSSNKETIIESENSTAARPGPCSHPFAGSLYIRITLAVYGILGLIACHLMRPHDIICSFNSTPSKLSHQLAYLLSYDCGWPVFLFAIFAMTCLGMVIQNTAWAISKPWVRFGIFTGPIVCCWYMVAYSWTVLNTPWSVVGLLIGAVIWLYVVHSVAGLLTHKSEGLQFCTGMMLFCLIFTGLFNGGLLALVFFSTPLAFLTYLGVSVRILERHTPTRRVTMAQLMIWVTWLTAFTAAIRTTVELSFAKCGYYFIF